MRFRFVDRICALETGKRVHGIKNISWDGDFLEEIFPGLPIFSPVIAAEAAAQTLSWLIVEATDFKYKPLITILDSYICLRHIQPGDQIEMEGEIDRLEPESALAHARILLNQSPAIEINHGVCYLYPLHELEEPESARRQFQHLVSGNDLTVSAPHSTTSFRHREDIPLVQRTWVDRIVAYEDSKKIIGIKNVTATEDYFNDHFPLKPILPGVLIIESLVSTAKILIERILHENALTSKKPVLKSTRKVKFRKFVQPGDQLILDVQLDGFNHDDSTVKAKALVNDKMVSTLNAEFRHLTREEYIKTYLE